MSLTVLLVFICLIASLSGCTSKEDTGRMPALNCNQRVLGKVLTMPSLAADSVEIKQSEQALGSHIRRPGYRWGPIYYMPDYKNSIPRWGNPHLLEEALQGAVVAKRYELDWNRLGLTGGLMIDDGLDVARVNKVWLPIFYRPSPMDGLNMVVAYQMVDSVYDGSEGSGWSQLPDKAVAMLYHRDAVLDTLYPELRNRSNLDHSAFESLFKCLEAHFDSLVLPGPSAYSHSWSTDLGSTELPYHDKPFRSLIRHRAWLTVDSLAVELYCNPANPPDTYVIYNGGANSFLLDTITSTYRLVPDSTPGSQEYVYDIQWEDLAIWIVYTYVGTKPKAPTNPAQQSGHPDPNLKNPALPRL